MGRGADMTPPLRWRLSVAGGVALVVLLVDQLTKLAVRAVGDALRVTVIPGVIDFMFVRNIGAAFSMGEGHGIAFAVLALAVIIAIAVYLVRAPQLAHLEVVGMAMVAGGAIGNAIDRLAFGFVTDFIATTFIDFPVFNVADIGITVGVVLALFGYMFLSPAAREVDATPRSVMLVTRPAPSARLNNVGSVPARFAKGLSANGRHPYPCCRRCRWSAS